MAEHAAAGDKVTLQRGRVLVHEGRVLRPGQLFDRDDPVVRAHPGRFVVARQGAELAEPEPDPLDASEVQEDET